MGAAANKQFRGGHHTTTTGNDPKAVAVKLIVDALTKFQKNYPNERIGIDNPRSYDPTLFKRTVMEAAAEFRCEHALAELTEKDVEELGLQYCESMTQQQSSSIPLATVRPPSLGRPSSLGGGNGNGSGGNSTINSVHHTELLVEDVMDHEVDDRDAGGGIKERGIIPVSALAAAAPSSSSSSSMRRRPLFDEMDNRTMTERMTPERPNSSHEMSYVSNNLRTSSSQRGMHLNVSSGLPRPLSSGGSHERGISSSGNGGINGININLSSPMSSHAASRSVQPFEAFPADPTIPSTNLPLSPFRRRYVVTIMSIPPHLTRLSHFFY